MSQIGRLLQGGILGGAQAYEDAARLHLAQEQARRDAQFDPVRMQNLQAELEDRRSRAERMRRGEAATKQVFEFMRAQRGRNQPGMVGPPAPAVDPFVALPVETLNDADPRVLETVMGDFDNEAAATRNVDEVRNRIAGAQQQGLVDFLPKEVWEPGLQMGLIRPQELAKNASFQRENGDKEADKRQALIDLLATRRQADGSLAFDAMSATRFAGMSLPQLEMQAKIMEANEKAAAVRAEQEARAAGLAGLPGEVGQRARMVLGATGEAPTGTALFNALEPAGTGQGMLTPHQRLQQVEQEYMAFNAVPNKEGRLVAGLLSPPTAAEVTRSQQPAVTKWGDGISDMDPTEHAALVAKVAKWGEYQQARAAVFGGGDAPLSAGGQAPGLGGAMGMPSVQPADESEAALLSAFRQRTGRDFNANDPADIQALSSIEAAMQPR
jgi:hypothetical protein